MNRVLAGFSVIGIMFLFLLYPAVSHDIPVVTGADVEPSIYEDCETAYAVVKIENEEIFTEPEKELIGTFSVTAYCDCPECQGKWVGQTAAGVRPIAHRTIAVDPSVIPLGTEVYIEGIGYRIAEDTGGAIKGNDIDVLMTSHEEAKDFGRKNLEVYLVK